MTGNAHKESCHQFLLILVREHGLHIIKTDCSDEMMVAFTITDKSYLMVSLFCQLVLPLSYLYSWYQVPNLAAIGLVSGIATKAAIFLFIFSFTNCYGYGFMLNFSLGILLQ